MKRTRWSLFFLILWVFFGSPSVMAEGDQEPVVYWVPIEQSIEQGLAQFLKRSLAEAEEDGAKAIIFEMDTLGGEVQAALEIGQMIRNTTVPTVVYIKGEAISAGAYIALNAQTILMEPGSVIGAAEPRTISGQTADPKTVAFWASNLRAAAEATGRNPEVAAAMADRSIVIQGLTKEDQLVSLSAKQAIQWDMADKMVENSEEVLSTLGLQDATIKRMDLTLSEKLARWLTSPYVIPILLLVGIGGLVMNILPQGLEYQGELD